MDEEGGGDQLFAVTLPSSSASARTGKLLGQGAVRGKYSSKYSSNLTTTFVVRGPGGGQISETVTSAPCRFFGEHGRHAGRKGRLEDGENRAFEMIPGFAVTCGEEYRCLGWVSTDRKDLMRDSPGLHVQDVPAIWWDPHLQDFVLYWTHAENR